ncbi:MAG: aminotransferase class I/II-fold pyridoxal phosphate-dependent enzyme [Bacteroidetes bacterium]|jgi:threonine aldolase|nr:aminotransferase class I/II-fold pyridoxal phosphate-dependent enzyme [Bacteroidota bacterium]
MTISFKNDYSEGCHPRVLEALVRTNRVQQDGYGIDVYSQRAAELIQEKAKAPTSKVHFVSGGTQANMLVIAACLKPHESVIAATTGHIYTNETGAIEATGHKINAIEASSGKLTPAHIQQVLDAHTNKPHVLKQRMVYISNATEMGTIYSKQELTDLYNFCKENDLYLFMDGARLGNALVAKDNNLTLADVAKLTDVFWLGGTKNGALLGEAIVINNPKLQEDFAFHIKQRGAMLAKGRVLGIQFEELLRDDLYFDLARYANEQAMKLKQAFSDKGILFWEDTTTNQIFPILSNTQIEHLAQNFAFHHWRKINETHSAIRLITSWATPSENVEALVREIGQL